MGFLLDSIEPSVSWSKCWSLIESIEHVWKEEMSRRKIKNVMAIRISQVYNDGACIYIYYGIGPTKDQDQLVTRIDL